MGHPEDEKSDILNECFLQIIAIIRDHGKKSKTFLLNIIERVTIYYVVQYNYIQTPKAYLKQNKMHTFKLASSR